MQITINGLSYRVRMPFDVHFIQTNQDQKSTVDIRGYVEEFTLTGYYFTYVCNNNMTTINHTSPQLKCAGSHNELHISYLHICSYLVGHSTCDLGGVDDDVRANMDVIIWTGKWTTRKG